MKNTIYGLAMVITVCTALAAEPDKEPTFLDPAKAGQDYSDQGEYTNAWGGAQVIALGNNKFHLVLYKGGLPGSGWDKSPRTEMDGRREEGIIKFQPKDAGWSHSINKGVLHSQSPEGENYTMNRTMRTSPTLGEKPPAGAIVLFDGSNADEWVNAHVDERHLLPAGTKSKRVFTNFTLHVEFMTPFKPTGRGQGRGNSGVYLQDRYEVQVLDSFGLSGEDNECGGIYTKAKPALNMCYPPLTWQTYDIDFTAATYGEDGRKIKNAVATIKHNGVPIHDRREINGPTGGGKAENPNGGAIQLQGHGNPVFYRNIWVVVK